jgi:hypothetical protein
MKRGSWRGEGEMIVAAMRKEEDLDKDVITANVHDARVTTTN